MARQRIRLTEGQLNRVIKESVKRVLKESDDDSLGYQNRYVSKNININDDKWRGGHTDGTDEKGKDGDYICWYVVSPETKEVAFEMAKYVHGRQNWVTQDECEKILGKPRGYFDHLKEY